MSDGDCPPLQIWPSSKYSQLRDGIGLTHHKLECPRSNKGTCQPVGWCGSLIWFKCFRRGWSTGDWAVSDFGCTGDACNSGQFTDFVHLCWHQIYLSILDHTIAFLRIIVSWFEGAAQHCIQAPAIPSSYHQSPAIIQISISHLSYEAHCWDNLQRWLHPSP